MNYVPRGVEMYNAKPIFYSLGNLIYGHSHANWDDNYVARLTLGPKQVTKVEIIPVAGRGNDLAQPYQLTGARARALLTQVQGVTKRLGTTMEIVGDAGVIKP